MKTITVYYFLECLQEPRKGQTPRWWYMPATPILMEWERVQYLWRHNGRLP